ncbi:ABC transporter permease [Microbulbifer sp. 2205BS26-8]|uniref:ABC transporter permease n=1 Tax=Microbulbifer sp. 2205BS26-8 TaxID=3064386 RepID=UPI00273F3343|nr:FtsX-like permease family protein [Microbulbifer sp. 2205BS26-8]MDP5210784.1 FtsX-like permease family protein [Microbulbifer sp. 2205BS26-8]
MTLFRLTLSNVFHKKPRAVFTIGSVVVAFLLFGLLLPLERVFNSRLEFADADRLIVTNKTSLLRPLPLSYDEQLRDVEGVQLVGHFTFFGAFYREPSNQIATIVTDADQFDAMVDEVVFRNPKDHAHWLKTPAGVAIGRELAQKFGWKVGDLVPVYSKIYPRADGSSVWTFEIAAIFDSSAADGDTNSMVIDYDYFDRVRATGQGTVGWYAVRIDDARNADRISNTIDAMFANRPAQTTTTTEKMFAQSFLRQVGDFGAMISIALLLVFWTVVLVTANTMAQSVRERFSDIGVLKTLGYSDLRIFGMVLGESLVILLFGGCLGLLIAAALIPEIAGRTEQLLGSLHLSWQDCALGLALMLVLALLVALVPAWRAARGEIVSALREAV